MDRRAPSAKSNILECCDPRRAITAKVGHRSAPLILASGLSLRTAAALLGLAPLQIRPQRNGQPHAAVVGIR